MNNEKIIKVVAALIVRNGKILIARRSTGDLISFSKWEFPGGKVEEGETEKQAIEREINEEFDVLIKAREYIDNNIFKYPNKTINLILYNCEYISGTFNLHDHFEYKWINIEELKNYDLADADIALSESIIKETRIIEKIKKI